MTDARLKELGQRFARRQITQLEITELLDHCHELRTLVTNLLPHVKPTKKAKRVLEFLDKFLNN